MADKKDTGTPVDASVGETSTPDLANTSESLDKKSPSDKTGDASESNSILATAGSDILSKDEEGSPTKGENDENGEARKDEEGGQRRDPLRSKRIPYVNPDRYKTGGPQREKLTPEELAERMDRIRLNNEKIKERRLAVQADEQAFKESQLALQAKEAETRKIQEAISRSREQNARRKMEKINNREWDFNKGDRGGGPASRGRGRGGDRPNRRLPAQGKLRNQPSTSPEKESARLQDGISTEGTGWGQGEADWGQDTTTKSEESGWGQGEANWGQDTTTKSEEPGWGQGEANWGQDVTETAKSDKSGRGQGASSSTAREKSTETGLGQSASDWGPGQNNSGW